MSERLVQATDLYQIARITDLDLSPDGETVAFIVERVEEKSEKKYTNIWVAPAGGGEPRQFTYGDQRDGNPRFSPDGTQIAFLSNRGNEQQAQIYLIPLHGGEARPLTELKGVIAGFRWSPDGTRLAMLLREPDPEELERQEDEQMKKLGVVARRYERVFFKSNGQGYLPQKQFHIWVVDAESGATTQITSDDKYSEQLPDWSPDGETLLFASNRHEDPDFNLDAVKLYTVPASGGDLTELEITHQYRKYAARFSPDGKWIMYLGQQLEDNWWQNADIFVVPAGGGEARNLTGEHDIHCASVTGGDIGGSADVNAPVWSGDSDALYVVITRHGNQPLMKIDLDGNLETVIDDEGVAGHFDLSADQTRMAYFHADQYDPGQLFLREMESGDTRQLTHLNAGYFAERDLGTIEELWVDGPDGNKIQGWILYPPDFDESKTYPSILEIHGGPQTQYGNFFMHEFHVLAAQGYVVYYCNPRGSQGYGADWCGAIYRQWGTVDYDDVMAFTDAVAEKPFIDTDRMGVTGGSYGGYMTTWVIGHTDRFQAAVVQRTVSNFLSMWGSTDFNWGTEKLAGLEGLPWDNTDKYWEHSPMKYIGNCTTPTMVIHSERDFRTDKEQGEQLFVALKKLGLDAELILFPDETHDLSRTGRTDRRVARLENMSRWFNNHVK